MVTSDSTIKKSIINKFALDVLNTFEIKPPFNNDIDKAVERLGGYVIEDDTLGLGCDGYIKKVNDNVFEIGVSPYQSNERRNFTIAHEIGHLFLHMGYLIDEEKWKKQSHRCYFRDGDSEQEYEANEFAAAFLMPEEEYKEVLEKSIVKEDPKLVKIGDIAKYFQVSVNAASTRGKWLGYLRW